MSQSRVTRAPAPRRPDALVLAASALAVDAVTAEVLEAWRADAVHALLLKGPTVADWLYDRGPVRGYTDSDFLVSPGSLPTATRTLTSLGFVETPYADPTTSLHAVPWVRARDGAVVDLHHALWGTEGTPPQRQWRTLSDWTEPFTVGGVTADVPTPPARALLVVLHAAQHRDIGGKPLEDLRRALARVSDQDWERASALADELGALRALADGLRLLPEGESLATRLPLVQAQLAPSEERSLALARARLTRARSVAELGRTLSSGLGLGPHALRRRYAVARSGPAGLLAAGILRVGRLASRAPRAIALLRRTR